MAVIVSIMHAASFAMYGASLVANLKYIKEDVNLPAVSGLFNYQGYGGKFKYLTFWNLIFQTVYFGLALVNDLVGSNEGINSTRRQSRLQKWRDTMFSSIAWPIGTFVVLMFWTLYAIDRELVFPKRLDAIVPSWLNHIMHTTVIVFLLLEHIAVYHWYPRSRRFGIGILIMFGIAYQLWLLWIAYYAELWVYPILQVLSWPTRIVFFAVIWIMFVGLYISGEKLTNTIWGNARRTKKVQ